MIFDHESGQSAHIPGATADIDDYDVYWQPERGEWMVFSKAGKGKSFWLKKLLGNKKAKSAAGSEAGPSQTLPVVGLPGTSAGVAVGAPVAVAAPSAVAAGASEAIAAPESPGAVAAPSIVAEVAPEAVADPAVAAVAQEAVADPAVAAVAPEVAVAEPVVAVATAADAGSATCPPPQPETPGESLLAVMHGRGAGANAAPNPTTGLARRGRPAVAARK